jgi:hypothetical protein
MKQRNTMIFGSLVLGSILTFSLYGIGASMASGRYDSEHEYEDRHDERSESSEYLSKYGSEYGRGNPARGAKNEMYSEECGSCHMAYPARFLPPQSWQKIMAGLDDHFGENAEVAESTRQSIENYLVQAAQPDSRRYSELSRNMGDSAPLRITELPHFRHEHDELPAEFVQGNDKVRSLSQCNACHRNAEKGLFDEDNVFIPGVGRWDD